MTDSNSAAAPLPGPRNRALAILLISVFGLFLELMLIRWIGTEVRIFAYLQNTVLIVCLLGLGMGCFTSHKPASIRNVLIPLLALVVLLALPPTRAVLASITQLLSVLDDLPIWEHSRAATRLTAASWVVGGLALTFSLMILIWEMFVPVGRILGKLLDRPGHVIGAYSVNVAGSLLGIWLFAALSACSLAPPVWLACACVCLLPFVWHGPQRMLNLGLTAALLAAAVFVGQESGALETHWSPYQKLALKHAPKENYKWAGKLIEVNNAGYQGMIDLDPARVLANPRIPEELRGLSQYDLPLRFKPNPARVLIVGAGSGNDAAGALRGGAAHVTAVEIDPAIIEMGRRHHPERPYDSPQVRVVADDARSFFATTQEKYDLIIFGLLDSHTTTAMTNARLDHYVYTRESISRAQGLLAPEGIVVLSFEALKPYIADRMSSCLTEVFEQAPLAFRVPGNSTGWGGVMFVAGDQAKIREALSQDARLAEHVARCQAEFPLQLANQASVPTDDWPYIYLEHARIPTLYYLLAGLLAALLWYGGRRLQVPLWNGAWRQKEWHFFFMGAAFLLLEVQNISKASVVLGNTWIVSAVIISAILVMILFANLLVACLPKLPQTVLFGLLIVTCLAMYLVDLSTFAFLAYPIKALLVGTLTTLPMLFAGMIFIDSFASAEHKDRALGANLVGSLVGGLLQSLTFVIGIKALLLLVAGLYLCAWFTRAEAGRRSTEEAENDFDKVRLPEEAPERAELAEPIGVA